jgi:hypothetical protein
LTHLQYVDDTVIFWRQMKILLQIPSSFCTALRMSGLKINYHKSEVTVLGVPSEESARIAKLLNCIEGSLPLKYLGITVSNLKLYVANLIYVRVKVEKRLSAW